jgi:hypothetical protein
MPSPYTTAAERLNAFVNLDRGLAADLAELSRRQSRDAALTEALETGRSYQTRQIHAQMHAQKKLNAFLRHEPFVTESF